MLLIFSIVHRGITLFRIISGFKTMKRAFSDFVLTVSYPWIFRITLLWTILYDNWNHFSKRRHSFFFFLIHSRHFNRIHPHIYKTITLRLFLYNNFSFLKINFKDHISKNLSIEYFKLLNTFSHFDITSSYTSSNALHSL